MTKLVWTMLAAGTMLAGCASAPTGTMIPTQQAAAPAQAVYHVQGGQVAEPAPAPVQQPVVAPPLPCVGCNPIPLPIGAGYSPDWLDDILAREADYSACGPDPCADGIPLPVWAGPAANNLGIGFTYGPNPYITIPDHRRGHVLRH